MKRSRLARSSFLSSLPFLLVCCAAYAADPRLLQSDWSQTWFWWLFCAVQVLVSLGYLMSSLPKWGRWIDGAADTEYKLNIIVGVLFALVAGNLGYYLGYYEAQLKLLWCMLTALAGGFAGEKWLAPFLMRLLPVNAPVAPPPTNQGG
jgi:hypothetical protein